MDSETFEQRLRIEIEQVRRNATNTWKDTLPWTDWFTAGAHWAYSLGLEKPRKKLKRIRSSGMPFEENKYERVWRGLDEIEKRRHSPGNVKAMIEQIRQEVRRM